jgi:dTDP-4-dehydrorhamnose 3,5-epimerase
MAKTPFKTELDMIFTPTALAGSYIIDITGAEDARGFFKRAWCRREFEVRELIFSPVQMNLSYSRERGTLRGLHYQIAPSKEAKLIRCIRGAIHDVIIDLREESSTFKQACAIELTCANRRMVYVPEGCAHGFLSLQDDTEVLYLVSDYYAPEHERGVRYDDPAFAVRWPLDVRTISDKDCNWPDYQS